jgi:hypothetical protein
MTKRVSPDGSGQSPGMLAGSTEPVKLFARGAS